MKPDNTEYKDQLKIKTRQLKEKIAPFFDGKLEVFESNHIHYRMRCEFRIWHQGDDTYHIMFDPITKMKIRVDQFHPASKLINEAMLIIMAEVKKQPRLRDKLYQIDYLTTLSNELLVSMIYKQPISEDWREAALKLRAKLETIAPSNIIGRARKQKLLLFNDHVTEILHVHGREFYFKQIENSFTQPNAGVNIKMIEWSLKVSEGIKGDLLELYCGAGNFSIPLSSKFRKVLGTEISKTSVAAAQVNIIKNKINNLTIARLSSEEFSQAFLHETQFRRLSEVNLAEYAFSTVFVDPPRAGLDEMTLKLVSKFHNIIYISCNPETLIQNLSALDNSHEVKGAAFFDQFPFTHHIEAGVWLSKKH